MRITFYIPALLFGWRHRAADTPDTVEALVIELAVGDVEGVQESPNIIIRPIYDRGNKKRLLAADAAKHSLSVRVDNSNLLIAFRFAAAPNVIILLALLMEKLQ